MTSSTWRALALALALAATPLWCGCQTGEDAPASPQENPPAGPSTPATPPPGPAASRGPIAPLMDKLAGGPDSLTPKLGQQLKTESPDWETIQGETKEYAAAAREMATHEPPRGSKQSWEELAGAFTEHADELDRAAQAKDKAAALVAHDQLAISCKACHDAHQPRFDPARGGGL